MLKRLLIILAVLLVSTSCTTAFSCSVATDSELQDALENPLCQNITVQPGQYADYIAVMRNGVTLTCAEPQGCTSGEIDLYGDYVTLSNWLLGHKDYKVGVRTYGDGNIVEYNEIRHTKEDGIWFWGSNVTIQHNFIHDILHPELPQYPEFDQHVDCFMTWAWDWEDVIDEVDNVTVEGNVCIHTRPAGSNQFFIMTHNDPVVPITNILFIDNVFISADTGYMPLAFYGDVSNIGMLVSGNTFYGQGAANPVYVDGPIVDVVDNIACGYYGDFVRGEAVQQGNVTCD